jgi:cation transport ATPase
MFPKLLLLATAACMAHAEFLRIEVHMKDLDCASCSASMATAFERIRGVKHVVVGMTEGTVTLELADQNHVTLEQIWDTVKRIGFTPGETKVTVRGTVKDSSLEISVIGKTIAIEGSAAEGQNVELRGTIAPPPDPRTPLKLRVPQ